MPSDSPSSDIRRDIGLETFIDHNENTDVKTPTETTDDVTPSKNTLSRRKPDPSKVVCNGEGLKFGYINRPIEATIETKLAGPGELTVYCKGPERNAYCELRDHQNGEYTLVINAQDVGPHILHVLYNDVEVPGSPFKLRVSPASLVRMRGPGLYHGILDKHKGEFLIETRAAGPGEIRLKVGGPRGAFKVKTRREGRCLVCRYNPKDSGLYIINIYWSGDHLPGSPFKIYLAKTQLELDQYLSVQTTMA